MTLTLTLTLHRETFAAALDRIWREAGQEDRILDPDMTVLAFADTVRVGRWHVAAESRARRVGPAPAAVTDDWLDRQTAARRRLQSFSRSGGLVYASKAHMCAAWLATALDERMCSAIRGEPVTDEEARWRAEGDGP